MSNPSSVSKARPALILLLCVALSSCCKRDIQARHPSPSGARVLTIVRVDCAGFDSFRTEVRLGGIDATAHPSGGEIVATISSSPVVQVTWADESSVVVFVPTDYDVQ